MIQDFYKQPAALTSAEIRQLVDGVYLSTALNDMSLPQSVLFELFASFTAAAAFFVDLHLSGQIGCFIRASFSFPGNTVWRKPLMVSGLRLCNG